MGKNAPSNDSQNVKLLLGSLFFVIAGIYSVTTDNSFIGYCCISFFGLGVVISLQRLIGKSSAKPTSDTSSGDIDWSISISNTNHRDVKKALQEYCKLYNTESVATTIRINELSSNDYMLTFPNGIHFEAFCFLVNFMVYPIGFEGASWSVRGWACPSSNEASAKISGKQLMLYVPPDDTEYDSVYITTAGNNGFKISFSGFHRPTKLDQTPRVFEKQPLLKNLNFRELEEIS